MRRDTAGDQVEARILERQGLGLGVSGADIGEAAFLRFALHLVEHFLSDVGRPDAPDMRCKGVSDMASAGGDVEHAPVFLRGGELDQPLKTFAERVRLTGEIVRGGLAELFLDQRLVHGTFRLVFPAGLSLGA